MKCTQYPAWILEQEGKIHAEPDGIQIDFGNK
jgi:hypothetical protein